MLHDDAYLAALADDAAALDALERQLPDLAVPVPACPGWTVGDLLGHVGGVHRWATALVTAPDGARVRLREVEQPPTGDDVVAWAAHGVAESLATLRAIDLDGPVTTWAGVATRRWWLRRLTLETAVHRVDLAQAAGDAAVLPGSLAVDAVDELFEVFVPARVTPEALRSLGGTVHLHRTDPDDATADGFGPGEWLLTIDDGTLAVEHTHAKGDVAARGPASALALVLWHRAPVDDLEVFGDRALLDGLLSVVSF